MAMISYIIPSLTVIFRYSNITHKGHCQLRGLSLNDHCQPLDLSFNDHRQLQYLSLNDYHQQDYLISSGQR